MKRDPNYIPAIIAISRKEFDALVRALGEDDPQPRPEIVELFRKAPPIDVK